MTTLVSLATAAVIMLSCLLVGDRFPFSRMSMFAYGVVEQELVVFATLDGFIVPAPQLLGISTMNLSAVWVVDFGGADSDAFVSWCEDRLLDPRGGGLLVVNCRLSVARDGRVASTAHLLGVLAEDAR